MSSIFYIATMVASFSLTLLFYYLSIDPAGLSIFWILIEFLLPLNILLMSPRPFSGPKACKTAENWTIE